MSNSRDAIREGVKRFGLGAWIAVFALALAIIAPLSPGARFLRSLVAPNPPAPNQPGDPAQNKQERAADFAAMLKQFDGRTLMRSPAAPTVATVEPDDPGKPPPPPTVYGGPSIIAMINGEVWFSDGTILSEGDEPKDDIKIVKTNPPWDATVLWKGVEFKVELFARNQLVYKDAEVDDSTPRVQAAPFDPAPEKPPEPKKKDEPKPDAPPAGGSGQPPPPPADGGGAPARSDGRGT